MNQFLLALQEKTKNEFPLYQAKFASVIVSKTGNPIKLTENYNQKYCNRNMNRNRTNVVRLTESKLREMIKEAATQVLMEAIPEYGMKSMQAYGNNQFN